MKLTAKVLLLVSVFAMSAFAQESAMDVAYVDVTVTNTAARVRIVPNTNDSRYQGDSADVQAGQTATLTLFAPDGEFQVSVSHNAARRQGAAAHAAYRRGNLRLSMQSQNFENAQISLYSVNGRRIMRANAGRGTENISRRNVAAGVYIVNVTGANGGNFSHRFTHGGGRLNIVTSFDGGSDVRPLMRQAEVAELLNSIGWTLSTTAVSDEFIDTSYAFTPQSDYHNPPQTITLRQVVTQPATGKTALEFFRDENIKLGWNLGNTLDAVCRNENNAPCVGNLNRAVEGAWGTPAATQALINGLAAQGVDIVRVTASWNGHIGNAPNYTITPARLNRVQEVVDWVLGAGMKAIVNIHHDGNYTNPPNTWGFLQFAEVMRGAANNEQVIDQLGKVWTQIATRFRDYGPELIFETLNEVHTGNWGGRNGTPNPAHGRTYNDEQDLLFEWNTVALNAIRATGGNNATRYVAVPALGSTEPEYVIDAHRRGRLLPPDGNNGASRLIVSVHFYAPWRFTVAEATGQTGSNLIHTITTAELNFIDTEAARIKSTFIDNGIAVYYGEWGAPTRTRASMDQEIRDRHVNYIYRVASAATQNGIVPIIWDDGGNFQIINRSNGNPVSNPAFHTTVWNAYKAAVAGEPNPVVTPPTNDPVPPTNITGNLGNYVFGTAENGVDPNYTQARWTLTPQQVTAAKAPGASVVLTLSRPPTGAAQFVWQGPANSIWWQEGSDILGATGSSIKAGVTLNGNTLTINLSQALVDYSTFIAQSSLNLILAYYGGTSINDLGITSANLQ